MEEENSDEIDSEVRVIRDVRLWIILRGKKRTKKNWIRLRSRRDSKDIASSTLIDPHQRDVRNNKSIHKSRHNYCDSITWQINCYVEVGKFEMWVT